MINALIKKRLFLSLALFVLLSASVVAQASDWAEWRGPMRDGISTEKNLPVKWSPGGENLSWKAPYGGRSAPIVMGDRVYLQNGAEAGAKLQERVMCFNADTGKLLWEHRFNVYLSDVPPHRIGWASPVGDPLTGNVYVQGVGGNLIALSKDGKVLWERSLGEDFGLLTTHGGRTVSPLIDGDLVIASGPTFSWANHFNGSHRFMGFDKKTGETIWVSTPGRRPYDTTYAAPIIADINGTRLLIQGTSDGFVHAIKPQTGEPVWKVEISKRGINTGVVVKDNLAILTHSEENLDSSEMGMVAAVDATMKGEIKKEQMKWNVKGWQGGFSSPVIDGDRFYQIDNSANLAAFEIATGKQLWLKNLGTIQRASPVLADGKLYVGTENGKFFILKPGATGCEILDEDQLGTEAVPEKIIGSVAISDGRVFMATEEHLYCIGKKSNSTSRPKEEKSVFEETGAPLTSVTHVQVVPTELTLKPGESVSFRVQLFDERGKRLIPGLGPTSPSWSLDQLKGKVENGQFIASSDAIAQTGTVKATINGVTGEARIRIVPPLPWSDNFESMAVDTFPQHWTNTGSKYKVREVNGNKVLVKTTEGSSLLSRARAYMGPSDLSNYTVEADIMATEKRRQMGEAGVIAQRYVLSLFGNSQRLDLTPWQPETARATSVPFPWKADTWYRMKLQVENMPDGKVRARGKVWAVGEAEPANWTIEHMDSIGNHQGSPGIYGNALAEIFFDNIKVTANK